MFNRCIRAAALAALAALAVSGCSRPQEVHPALWQVDGPEGQRGWLFATIHALPAPVQWRSAQVDDALTKADMLVLEVAAINDDARTARILASLSHTPGQPPLSQRVDPALRPTLSHLLEMAGKRDDQFGDTETWAAALWLANAMESHGDSANGIDRALAGAVGERPVVELEGAERQLSIFDGLPQEDQRDLLNAIISGTAKAPQESLRLRKAWAKGDMTTIAAATNEGMLTDPELREALLNARNRDWTIRIAALMKARSAPFVAVGAAHLAGSEGVPALLAGRGYKVTRLQ